MYSKLSVCVFLFVLVAVQSQNENIYNNNNYPYRNYYARILRLDSDVRSNGYDFVYETDDPIYRQESGNFVGTGKVDQNGHEIGANRVSGYAAYNLLDGTPFTLTFDADEYGYRPRYTIGTPSARSVNSRTATGQSVRPPFQ